MSSVFPKTRILFRTCLLSELPSHPFSFTLNVPIFYTLLPRRAGTWIRPRDHDESRLSACKLWHNTALRISLRLSVSGRTEVRICRSRGRTGEDFGDGGWVGKWNSVERRLGKFHSLMCGQAHTAPACKVGEEGERQTSRKHTHPAMGLRAGTIIRTNLQGK